MTTRTACHHESPAFEQRGCVAIITGLDPRAAEWDLVFPLDAAAVRQQATLRDLRELARAGHVERVEGLSEVDSALLRVACASCTWLDPEDHFEVGPGFVASTRRVLHAAIDRLATMAPADLAVVVYAEEGGQRAIGYRLAAQRRLDVCARVARVLGMEPLALAFESGARRGRKTT